MTLTVIAVLIALLLPALRGARASAQRVKCLQHLHSLGLGIAGYIGDHDALPLASRLSRVDTGTPSEPAALELPNALESYLSAPPLSDGRFAPPWVCPSDPAGRGAVEGSYGYRAADEMFEVRPLDPFLAPTDPRIGRLVLLWYEDNPRAWVMQDADRYHTRQPRIGSPDGFNCLFLDGSAAPGR